MALPKIVIGKSEIEVSEAHIYVSPGLSPTYDYVPWNIIGKVIEEAPLKNVHLIDIGANVGDSLAHFRRLSPAPVTCIEPSAQFFKILERNAKQFQNVQLENKLFSPPDLIGKVYFASGPQTGSSSVGQGEKLWTGPSITFDELMSNESTNYIVKTDTDGFDADVLKSLLATLRSREVKVPIIFFEGPSAQQYIDRNLDNWMDVIGGLQAKGYRLLFLSNIGIPYAYAGKSFPVARSILQALVTGYQTKRALCHYYDVIAVADGVNSDVFTLERAWAAELFRRS